MKKVICFAVLLMIISFQNQSYARVIYEIDKPSMNSYKVKLKFDIVDKKNKIQITGYKKYNDDTLKVSYQTGEDVYEYSEITVTNDMVNFEFENTNRIYPNIKLEGNNEILTDVIKLEETERRDSIENLYNKGIINGYSDNTFKPQTNITREEFCSLFYNIIDIKEETKKNNFEDVDEGRWSNKYISALASKGILKGKTNTKFQPRDNITIGEISAIIDRTYSLVEILKDRQYKHEQNKHWSNSFITKMINSGIIKENDDFYKNYNQDKKATREEISIILNRLINMYKNLR